MLLGGLFHTHMERSPDKELPGGGASVLSRQQDLGRSANFTVQEAPWSLCSPKCFGIPCCIEGTRQLWSLHALRQLKDFPVTVYFCRSCVISKQQANYSGCIPRKKELLTALPTVCWLLITQARRPSAGWLEGSEPSRGACPPDACASTGLWFSACWHPGSRCSGSGGHRRVCCHQWRGSNTCHRRVLCTGGQKAISLSQFEFQAVLPETGDCGVFLVRSEGIPGLLHAWFGKPVPCGAGPGRRLWSETLGCGTLGFPISPAMACLNPVLFS